MARFFLLNPVTDWLVRLALSVRRAQIDATGIYDVEAKYERG
tara:strand:+ start:912 stop:1037 length:126 start_codon:yes stop_codon:yes gene_type:complete